MENKMILEFIIALFGTLIIVRLLAYKYHDMENYDRFNPRNSKAKTITGWLRRKTGFDWHHIHLGFIIMIASIISVLIYGWNNLSIVFFAIGLSMIADQITPLIDRKSNYFSREKLILSIIFHAVVALIAIFIFLII